RGFRSIDYQACSTFSTRNLTWWRFFVPLCPPDADLVNKGEYDSRHKWYIGRVPINVKLVTDKFRLITFFLYFRVNNFLKKHANP
ncbi:MAG: hypothetical protein Q6373_020770, partial [Candidatus Sigynarchaeota archaeon]